MRKYFVFLLAILCIAIYADPITNTKLRSADGSFDSYLWQDLRVPLTTTKINVAQPPTFDNWLGNLGAYQFSGSANNECFFEVQIPHGIYGSRIECHVHYSVPTTVASTITFGLEYSIAGTNRVWSTPTTIQGSKYNSASFTHLLCELGWIDLPTQGIDSGMISCRFYRLGTDTYTGLANVFEIDFHYQTGAVGSKNEYGDR